jgi:sugar phosphate isomerase/epimerase
MEKTKKVCEIANKVGTKNIRMFSFYMPDGMKAEDCKNQVYDRIGKMLDVADEYGVTLCHENEAKIYGESPERCREIIEQFGGRLKAVFDMGNFVLDGYNPEDAYGILKNHIEYFHIKDALYAGAIVPPGKGEAEIEKILEMYMEEFNRDTFVTLEPHLQTFDGLNQLVGKTFDNPYKFETKEIAFDTALNNIKEKIYGKYRFIGI